VMLKVPALLLSRDLNIGWKSLARLNKTSDCGFSVFKMALLALLAVLTKLAARVAQLARSDPRWGVPKNAMARVQSRICL
jgi:hypothetical protein